MRNFAGKYQTGRYRALWRINSYITLELDATFDIAPINNRKCSLYSS